MGVQNIFLEETYVNQDMLYRAEIITIHKGPLLDPVLSSVTTPEKSNKVSDFFIIIIYFVIAFAKLRPMGFQEYFLVLFLPIATLLSQKIDYHLRKDQQYSPLCFQWTGRSLMLYCRLPMSCLLQTRQATHHLKVTRQVRS